MGWDGMGWDGMGWDDMGWRIFVQHHLGGTQTNVLQMTIWCNGATGHSHSVQQRTSSQPRAQQPRCPHGYNAPNPDKKHITKTAWRLGLTGTAVPGQSGAKYVLHITFRYLRSVVLRPRDCSKKIVQKVRSLKL